MLTQVGTIDRSQVVEALARIRQEWEQATDGSSLIDAQTSVGLFLGDVVIMLGLSSDEQRAVMGNQLRRDFIRALRSR